MVPSFATLFSSDDKLMMLGSSFAISSTSVSLPRRIISVALSFGSGNAQRFDATQKSLYSSNHIDVCVEIARSFRTSATDLPGATKKNGIIVSVSSSTLKNL